jgi:hypothetical protein
MSILRDGVFSSTSYHGRGMFGFDRSSYKNKLVLKSIKKRQRRKFKDHGLIPKQVLQVLWDLGYPSIFTLNLLPRNSLAGTNSLYITSAPFL